MIRTSNRAATTRITYKMLGIYIGQINASDIPRAECVAAVVFTPPSTPSPEPPKDTAPTGNGIGGGVK